MITFDIFLKLMLAMVLTAIPFAFHAYVMPKSEKQYKWKNSMTWLSTKSAFFGKYKKKFMAFTHTFEEGMKYNRKIRKFYILLMVIVLLALELVDVRTSQEIAAYVMSYTKGSPIKAYDIEFLYPLLTHPAATVSMFIFTIALLSYRLSNFILTKLSNNIWLFIFTSVATGLFGIICNGRLILVSLIMVIILNWACYYPNMDTGEINQNNKDTAKGQNRGKRNG